MSSNSNSITFDVTVLYPIFFMCLLLNVFVNNPFTEFISWVSVSVYFVCTVFVAILSAVLLVAPSYVKVTKTQNLKNLSKSTIRDIAIVELSIISMFIVGLQYGHPSYAYLSAATQVCVIIMFTYARLIKGSENLDEV